MNGIWRSSLRCPHFCWRNVWVIWGYVHSVIHLSWRHSFFCSVLTIKLYAFFSSCRILVNGILWLDENFCWGCFLWNLTLRRQDVWYSFLGHNSYMRFFDICLVWNFLCSAKVEFSAASCLALHITCEKVYFTLSLLRLYFVFTLLSSGICCRRILV